MARTRATKRGGSARGNAVSGSAGRGASATASASASAPSARNRDPSSPEAPDEPALHVSRSGTMETFENIYLDLSRRPGKCRIAESGLGWKAAGEGTFTLESNSLNAVQWSRAARGYELKIVSRSHDIIQLDGFEQEDFDRMSKCLKLFFGLNLENKEHALRGWNWGRADFSKGELAFSVQNRPAFEVPYSEVSNTNLAGKNEVSVELALPGDGNEPGTKDLGGARAKGHKAGAAKDQLCEIRFYVPGTTTTRKSKSEKKSKQTNGDAANGDGADGAGAGEEGSGDEEGEIDEEDEGEEQNAASLFYDTLLEKADIGEVAGDTFATFLDVLHLTPRGRFDVDMYEKSFRMRGKTYDYKVLYDSIKKFLILPKPDDLHTLICVGLDPPLRQGQTKYPFIVMQFKTDEEVELDLNMTPEMIEERYPGKLQAHYELAQYSIVANIFRGLAGKKITKPSSHFSSHHNQAGVKCSVKASEGYLYMLDKAFMFVPKPAQYLAFENVQLIVLSRVGGALAASRTFDVTVTMRHDLGEHQFSNINREEQKPLEDFFAAKQLKVRNEMVDDSNTLIAQALKDEDMASSEEEVVAGADRGSADEDEESVDEDFQADSDSDVAEEYDEDHVSSGSGTGDESDAAEDDRPKKKSKTG